MKLEAGRQFCQLVVVAWLAFSLGSVLLAMFSWMDQMRDRAGHLGEFSVLVEQLDPRA